MEKSDGEEGGGEAVNACNTKGRKRKKRGRKYGIEIRYPMTRGNPDGCKIFGVRYFLYLHLTSHIRLLISWKLEMEKILVSEY